MSNGVRHVLGVVVGIILPPLIAVGLMYGVTEVNVSFHNFVVSWAGLALIVLCGALLAVLASSRVSPIGALLGGIFFTLLGVLPFIEIMSGPIVPDSLMTGWVRNGYLTLGLTGAFLLLGVVLLVASAFPSRWRSRRPAAVTAGYGAPAYHESPGYGPQGQVQQGYGTSQGHQASSSYGPSSYGEVPDDTTRPMHRE
ncbi:hypothetical protein JYK22_09760, partial [Nonomuraea sp. RK-328]|nr:hypothetical protein [Nonomuraea sp. RK-328]